MPGWSGLFNGVYETASDPALTNKVGNKVNRNAVGRKLAVALTRRGGMQVKALLSAYITGTPSVTAETIRIVKNKVATTPADGSGYKSPEVGSYTENNYLGANATAAVTLPWGTQNNTGNASAHSADVTAINEILEQSQEAPLTATDLGGNGGGGNLTKRFTTGTPST